MVSSGKVCVDLANVVCLKKQFDTINIDGSGETGREEFHIKNNKPRIFVSINFCL